MRRGDRTRWLGVIGTLIAVGLLGLAGPANAWANFGFIPGETTLSLSDSQAGGHPDLTTAFKMNATNEVPEGGTLKDISVDMPPGFSGSAIATPTCTEAALPLDECPKAARVGFLTTRFLEYGTPNTLGSYVYNLRPDADAAAQFGVNIGGLFNVILKARVRPNDYGVTVESRDNPDLFPVLSAQLTLWGVPAENNASGADPRALLTNPSECGIRNSAVFNANSWQGAPATESVPLPMFTGCAKLSDLEPFLTIAPENGVAGEPSGFDIDLEVPQIENPDGVATPPIRKITMRLPAGIHISPPAANGMEACTDEEVGFGSSTPIGCPEASKVGSVTVETPALAAPLKGSIYVGQPLSGELYRLILALEGPGVTIKLRGSVMADKETGQLMTTFDDTPELPFGALHVHLWGGPRALLANPTNCGVYTGSTHLTPYGDGPTVAASSSFRINERCGSAGFSPQLDAGVLNPMAGADSPFVFALDREDGEQNVLAIDVALPPGELAKLAGVQLCPNALANSGGCPAGSQVGYVVIATGSGALPLWIPQPGKEPTAVYLAGPYKGAPYSIVAKVPAQAGPYDLGTVTVRSALYVNPETAQVTVESDHLPQILEGIPIYYRTIYVNINRPRFMVNPTNCAPMTVGADVTSASGAATKVFSPYRIGACGELGFRPRLGLRLFGKPSRGAHPRLRATLTMPKANQANIARASVALPHNEFLDQGHIRTVCTKVQFSEGEGHGERCPRGSIYGYAKAWSPLLERPLEGPVYLRSSSHKLPDLVAALNGQIQIALDGRIDSVNGGIRTTFESVPDAPVSRFVLVMKGGAKGLLVNSTNICRGAFRATANFDAHNGKIHDIEPLLRDSRCHRG